MGACGKEKIMQNRIAELLDEQGYKPATFAKKAGVPETTLYEILNGTRKFENVGVSRVLKIAKCFGVTVEYLSGEDNAPKTPVDKMKAELASACDQLNEQGCAELKNYAAYLLSQDRFKKKEVSDNNDRLQESA